MRKLAFRAALILPACVLMQACVAIQTYPGRPLPDDQIAKISPTFAIYGVYGKEIAVVSLDGNAIWEPLAVLEVLPGRHLVGVRYSGAALSIAVENESPCYLVVPAEAGGRYQVGGEYLIHEKRWRCWLANEITKARTPGIFLAGKLPPREELPALMDAMAAEIGRKSDVALGRAEMVWHSRFGSVPLSEGSAKSRLTYSESVRRISTASDALFSDMLTGIGGVGFADEVHAPEARRRELVQIEVIHPYDNRSTGVERWVVEHDGGDRSTYEVKFEPDGHGGTNFSVKAIAAEESNKPH